MSVIEENNIKALCLDIDGTLYSKMQMNLRLILTAFPNLKLGLRFNGIRKEYRLTQDSQPPRTFDRAGFLEKQAKLYLKRETSSVDEIEKIIKSMDKQFYQSWEKSFKSIKAFDNMRETLIKAKSKGLKIALLSDFPIAHKVETLGLKDIVDFAISSEETGFLKPDKHTFLHLTKNINIDPNNCIYFGDSYNKDIEGAKSIGMKTLYISNNNDKKKYEKADYICSNWREIETLLF